MRLSICAPVLLAGLLAAPSAAAAQDPVEFGRLSNDQKQLAEQVRRLEKILTEIEAREREAGGEARANLLQKAREKLVAGAKDRPLASVLEEVALDLADLRAGDALEQQAELILFLEELLDFLLETERREQVQDLMEAARNREAQLLELAERQAELRARTEALREQEARTGEVDEAERQAIADAQAALNEEIRAAAEGEESDAGAENAERAAQEGERAESSLREGSESEAGESAEGESEPKESESGEQGSESAEQSEGGEPNESGQPNESGEPNEGGEPNDPGEQPESQEQPPGEPQGERQPTEQQEANPQEANPQQGEQQQSQPGQPQQQQNSEQNQQQSRPSQPSDPQQQLEEAEKAQQRAEEELREGAEDAREEAERLADVDELETLINVLEKSEELLARHERVLSEFGSAVEQLDGASRVPRSLRVDLRKWSTEEKAIADEADALLFEIREAGADAFPFLLRGLVEDHEMFAGRMGPPKYRASHSTVEMGALIKRDWERLIEAIRIEAERVREKMEQPESERQGDQEGQDGEQPEPPPQPLVGLAVEIQLLKQLQEDLVERLQSLRSRRELLAEAGISLDEDELLELENLVERQKRLRNLFESILERLQEESPVGEEV